MSERQITTCENGVECPYCCAVFTYSGDVCGGFFSNEQETCPSCGGDFYVKMETEITHYFTSSNLEFDENE